MTDAPKSAISGILVVIVIFVVLIVFFTLMGDSSGQITDIFNEVFFGEQTATEEAKQNTIDALKDLLEQVEKCNYDENVNPEGENACFCFTGVFGVVSNAQYLSIHNGDKTMTATAYDSGGASLLTQQEAYEIGLFAVQITDAGEKLGCIFPEQYFIKGIDDEVKETSGYWGLDPSYASTNNWYVKWEDERGNKAASESGEDYYFGFYGDKYTIGTASDYSYGYYLRSAPKLYKLDDTKYCLLTDLIEHRLVDVSGLDYQPVYTLTEEQKKESAPFTDFFTDSSKYCNKEESSSTSTPTNTFAPSGTFYWVSQDTGGYGESTTLFGTKWNGGYICGVDPFSFSILFTAVSVEIQTKVREAYNSEHSEYPISEGGVIGFPDSLSYSDFVEETQGAYTISPACTFQVEDLDADNIPFLQITCQAQYATGYGSSMCNEVVDGNRYGQNLAPTDIENTIPDLNDNGFDPNLYYVSE
ncbi:hypothetical protein EXS74_02720 [Candidatus Woesearchaeota archaeon]|nr:hypothetical protein [Candidatus Woesearchaeota archaeon]